MSALELRDLMMGMSISLTRQPLQTPHKTNMGIKDAHCDRINTETNMKPNSNLPQVIPPKVTDALTR